MAAPVDLRLIKVSSAKKYLVGAGLIQAVDTMLLIGRGVLIGTIAAQVITYDHGQLGMLFATLLAVIVLTGAITWLRRFMTSQSVGTIITELQVKALAKLRQHDCREVSAESATWQFLLVDALPKLRPYFTSYIPALISLFLSTPAALAVVFYFDPLSGWLALATVPLIPIFMILIGTLTRDRTERKLDVAARLGSQLDDLIAGAPTIRNLGAGDVAKHNLEATTDAHRRSTMDVLRLAFLSSFALEFLATLSVALVAVGIGLRLVEGNMSLLAGLVVLIIVPEVYAPLRAVGASFHDATDGLTATDRILELIDKPAPPRGGYLAATAIGVKAEHLTIHGRDGARPQDLSFDAPAGQITILSGPNGSGKSTVFLASLGLLPDDSVNGSIQAPSLSDLAFLPARPTIELGKFSHTGSELSAGQAQMLAIDRVCEKPASTLLFDEPTAHLSPDLITGLKKKLRDLADSGKCVLVASHDPRLLPIADQVIAL